MSLSDSEEVPNAKRKKMERVEISGGSVTVKFDATDEQLAAFRAKKPLLFLLPAPSEGTAVQGQEIAAQDRLEIAAQGQEIAAQDQEIAVQDQEIAAEDREIAAEDREIAAEDQEIAAEDREIAAEDREIAAEDREIAAEDREIVAQDLEIAAQDQEIAAQDQEIAAQQDQDIASQDQEIAAQDKDIAAQGQKIAAKELQLAEKDRQVSAQESALSEKDCGLSPLQQRCGSLQTQLDTIHRSLQSMQEAGVKLPGTLAYKVPLKWKNTMPGVYGAQAVVVGGKVYIGGRRVEGDDYKILEYTIIDGGQWREIKTPVELFGMAVVNDQLIITGGENNATTNPTNQVWVLDVLTNTWTQPFPAMPTARSCSSAVGYKKWVLVVGGLYANLSNVVEVLDTESKQWYTALPLPNYYADYHFYRLSLAVMQDNLYVIREKNAVSVSIPILISDAMSQNTVDGSTKKPSPPEWKSLPDTTTCNPAITSFHGYLFAVGAQGRPESTIDVYLPHTERWLTVAQLPTQRDGCTCVVLPETGELMVIGGKATKSTYTKTIDICQ